MAPGTDATINSMSKRRWSRLPLTNDDAISSHSRQ
jgi:hypothetical protein